MKNSKKRVSRLLSVRDISIWYCVMALIGLLLTVIFLFASHGEYFSKFFFQDSLDSGMDFFHSIEYVDGRRPYELYSTLYPPLANLFFYILYRFVPFYQIERWAHSFEGGIIARGTDTDLRIWQPTFMLYVFFVMGTLLCTLFLLQKILTKLKVPNITAVCLLLSYGMLFAYERGNIIIISFICCLFFAFFKDHENPIISELSLLALAIGAGLKIYPALLGIVLIYDKQYIRALRTVIYGILAFILPCFVFHEGLGFLPIFLETLFGFVSTDEIATAGFSVTEICGSIVVMLNQIDEININFETFRIISTLCRYIIVIIVFISGFFVSKRWEKLLVCSLIMFMFQSQGIYSLIFMMIPFLAFMQEEVMIHKKNIVIFLAFVFTQITLPIAESQIRGISEVNFRFQLCMLISLGYIVSVSIGNIKQVRNKGGNFNCC